MIKRVCKQPALLLCFLLLVASGLGPRSAAAEASLGPHLGVNFDWGELFLGGEARVDLADLSPEVKLQLDPYLSLALFGHGSAIDLGCNVPFQFMIHDSSVRPFAAPGLAIIHYSGGHASDTQLYLNMIGGVLFDLGSVDPFVQLKVMVPHGSMAELMGGVLFKL
ncbi:MAG TPA: hypothetical protein VF331_09740 [Polyangiales bacterium]